MTIAGEELAALPLCAGLAPATTADLAREATGRTYEAGQVLWLAGSEAKGLHLILEGEVKIVRGRGSRQAVVHREGRGATLGEVPVLARGGYPATAIAVRRTRCAVISRAGLRGLITAHPELGFRLLERMAERVRSLVDRLDRVTLLDVRARLAAELLARADAATGGRTRGRDGRGEGEAAVEFTLGLSQSALAEELGTVREVIARALRGLARDGLVRSLGRGRYRVLDRIGLEAEVEGGNRGE